MCVLKVVYRISFISQIQTNEIEFGTNVEQRAHTIGYIDYRIFQICSDSERRKM